MPETVSKAQAIRDYLAENKKATADQVVAALAEKGTQVTVQNVYKVKSKPKRKSKRPKTVESTATKKVPTPPASGRGKNRPFPRRTLEEALAVPKAIREKNNGRPWPTDEVAKALGIPRKGDAFFYLCAASRDYGLSIGSRDTEMIELAPLGTEIFFAKDEATAQQKRIDAFMSVDLFKKVYDYYGGSKSIPETEFFNNVLQKEFNLSPEFHDEFAKIFKANCKFLAIEDGLSTVASAKAQRKETGVEDIRVVGEAKGKFDRTAFVIIPFSEKGESPRPTGFFDQVLKSIITPAANRAGFSVETAQQKGSDIIHTTIINRLLQADLVIADLSDHNPNVLFELGIRLAKEMPVALIRAAGTGRIFDVDIIRIEDYSPNIWPTTVEQDVPRLADHIKATWDNRSTMRPYMEILTGRSQATKQ
jgi:nucleoside 2-deoxyribosyltransferase